MKTKSKTKGEPTFPKGLRGTIRDVLKVNARLRGENEFLRNALKRLRELLHGSQS